MKCFFDTNILLYRFDTSESHKMAIAADLIDRCLLDRSFRISTQVMMEFYQRRHPQTRMHAVSPASAASVIAGWSRYDPVTITPSLIIEAAAIHQRHSFSWWDSTIVAAAVRCRSATCFTAKIMQHGRDFDGLRNPESVPHHASRQRTALNLSRRRRKR